MQIKRLQTIINELLMNPNEFAKSIGVSADTIYHILNGRSKTISPMVKRKMYETYPNINKDWFEEGKGEMFTWKEPIKPKSKGNKENEASQDKDFIIEQYQQLITSQQKLIDKLTTDLVSSRERISELLQEIKKYNQSK